MANDESITKYLNTKHKTQTPHLRHLVASANGRKTCVIRVDRHNPTSLN